MHDDENGEAENGLLIELERGWWERDTNGDNARVVAADVDDMKRGVISILIVFITITVH